MGSPLGGDRGVPKFADRGGGLTNSAGHEPLDKCDREMDGDPCFLTGLNRWYRQIGITMATGLPRPESIHHRDDKLAVWHRRA